MTRYKWLHTHYNTQTLLPMSLNRRLEVHLRNLQCVVPVCVLCKRIYNTLIDISTRPATYSVGLYIALSNLWLHRTNCDNCLCAFVQKIKHTVHCVVHAVVCWGHQSTQTFNIQRSQGNSIYKGFSFHQIRKRAVVSRGASNKKRFGSVHNNFFVSFLCTDEKTQ